MGARRYGSFCDDDSTHFSVVSSCTGTQRNETLTNCVTTPCMDMKTIGIPPCTGTPGQPPFFRLKSQRSRTRQLLFEDCRFIYFHSFEVGFSSQKRATVFI